jgi:deoxyadenosine/deoxycytidine kinase
MGKVIIIAGNSGVGKTTLAEALCRRQPFISGLEQHTERPFQALMAADPRRYALANQIDYLLLRAEQERLIRAGSAAGLIDGGLDLDFHGFTRLFHRKGYLTDAEFALIARLYGDLRDLLGPPHLILYLTAPLPVVESRYARRGRPLEIAQRDDLALMERFVGEWIAAERATPIIYIDAAAEDFCAPERLDTLLAKIDDSHPSLR